MKGCFLFGHAFLGGLLILLGISIFIKIIFGIDIPVLKIVFALFLIYMGVALLTGKSYFKYKWCAIPPSSMTHDTGTNTYNVYCAERVIDLTSISPTDAPITITVNASFSSVKIKVRKDTPLNARVNASFASAKLPDGNTISFGSHYYHSDASPIISLNVNISFGALEIIPQ